MSHSKQFRELMREISILDNLISTLEWDMRVNLPPKASVYRGETIGYLSGKVYGLRTSPRLKELADTLATQELDQITRAMVDKALKDYAWLTAIPADLYAAFAEHNLKTELLWQEARANNDYALIKDSMAKEFDFKRQFAELRGFGDNPMDGMVCECEEGLTTARIDALFAELKTGVRTLLDKIDNSPIRHDRHRLLGHYPVDKQREFCRLAVGTVGYDFGAGRLDESAHPFSFANDKTDIRMTTRYFEDNFVSAITSSLHEMGHSMYGQNPADALRGTTLDHSISLCWDEGQSRFFENIIGRSKPFWNHFLPIAKGYFATLGDISLDEFYQSLNAINPSPLRLQADEVTYNLHIIIRYELERMVFAGQVTFDELPEAWNQKYREYLGVTPKNDAEGILQDMHWCSGYIGAFENYVMGNFYDGHMLNKMRQDIPDMYEQVSGGKFDEIVAWQVRNVISHGRLYSPEALLQRVSGEKIAPTHYLNYLNDKYSIIYQL